MISKFWCTNRNCQNRYVPVLSESNVCNVCSFVMTEAFDLSGCKNIYGKFAFSSSVEKKAILKKRSDEHNKTKLERERREHLTKKALGIN